MSKFEGAEQTNSRASGLKMLVAGVAVFVVCAIIQAACGSSMFSTSYSDSGSTLKELLINVTFWPGWMLTVALVLGGVLRLAKDR